MNERLHPARRSNLHKCRCGKRVSPENDRRRPTEYSKVLDRPLGQNRKWYHEHHPGYFAVKTKEWIERLPESRRLALFAERNERTRTYVTAYSKLRRRVRGQAKGPPSFTTREKVEINNSAYLSELLRRVKAQHPRWFP